MLRRGALLIALAAAVLAIFSACGGFKPTATTAAAGGSSGGAVDGKAVYDKNCMACHGATGGGGIGPAFAKDADSKLLQIFPEAATQIEFVTKGSAAYPNGYGATNKKGTGAMPGWSSLKAEEIEAVVKYERSLAGG